MLGGVLLEKTVAVSLPITVLVLSMLAVGIVLSGHRFGFKPGRAEP
jgi:hypothetical protein